MGISRDEVIQKIVTYELDMFKQVKTKEEPPCRQFLDQFILHRKAQFSTWSLETCKSYENDLENAINNGINLLSIKYARMDDLIPPYSNNLFIPELVNIYCNWQALIIQHYPNLMRDSRPIDDFKRYLQCELETYSGRTLQLLHENVIQNVKIGLNMAEGVYSFLAIQLGFDTVAELDVKLAATRGYPLR